MKKIILSNLLLILAIFSYGQDLMPLPLQYEQKEGSFVLTEDLSVKVEGLESDRLYKYTDKVYRRISEKTGLFFTQDYLTSFNNPEKAQIVVKVKRGADYTFKENNSYKIKVDASSILIEAETDYGAFNALETLYQLVEVSEGKYVIPSCEINDKPRFPYRGLMLDVSRHFLSVDNVKRQIDLMSSVKLNVLHWHLADDQGYRLESKKRPNLHLKGSDGNYYTFEQVRDVVQYAKDRGIVIIPEIDVPGHASAILTAYPGLASKKRDYSIERNAGIFRPVLDPTNPETCKLMDDIISELAQLFPFEYIHIGGDENAGLDWKENKKISKFMKSNKIDNPHDLQAYFNLKLHKILKKYGKEMMGWEEIQNPKIPKSSLIHAWRGVNEGMEVGASVANAVKAGYTAVLSNGFYIDLMQHASDHYSTVIIPENADLSEKQKSMILGGEATMWAELVTELTIDSRVWPRTAAIAEKLWSPKSKTQDIDDMYRRLDIQSKRLEFIGANHLRNKDVIIRMISNNVNPEAVKTLVDACEPLKIYTRNPGGTMYKSFSPYTKFADACTADADTRRELEVLVKNYANDVEGSDKRLKEIFNSWIDQHDFFLEALENSPQLEEVKVKSQNLQQLGQIGLLVLSRKNLDSSGLNTISNKLDEMFKEDGGRTELAIVIPFKKMLYLFKSN